MEFIMGVVKSQLSPFNWKTILILVFAVGALFFAFRLFGKFNTAPEAVAEKEQEQETIQQLPPQPQHMVAPPQYEQQQLDQQQPNENTHYEQEAMVAAANE
jgi:type II secretory pathway component PulL